MGVLPSCHPLHVTHGVFPCELVWGHRTGVTAECRTGLHWDFWFGSSPRDVLNPWELTSIEAVVSKRWQGTLETLRILLFKGTGQESLAGAAISWCWWYQWCVGEAHVGLEVPEPLLYVGRQV